LLDVSGSELGCWSIKAEVPSSKVGVPSSKVRVPSSKVGVPGLKVGVSIKRAKVPSSEVER